MTHKEVAQDGQNWSLTYSATPRPYPCPPTKVRDVARASPGVGTILDLPPCNRPPPSFRLTPLPEGCGWETVKAVAGGLSQREETIRQRCVVGSVWAIQVGGEGGRWLIAVDRDGFPLDPPCATCLRVPCACERAPLPNLPEGCTWGTVRGVAGVVRMREEAIRLRCAEGSLWALQVAGEGDRWRIAVDVNGLPLDPPCPTCTTVTCACAAARDVAP